MVYGSPVARSAVSAVAGAPTLAVPDPVAVVLVVVGVAAAAVAAVAVLDLAGVDAAIVAAIAAGTLEMRISAF